MSFQQNQTCKETGNHDPYPVGESEEKSQQKLSDFPQLWNIVEKDFKAHLKQFKKTCFKNYNEHDNMLTGKDS